MTQIETLLEAIRNRDRAAVRRLLQEEPALLTARSESGESPVMTAIYHDAGAELAMLVARGAELDLFAAAALGDTPRLEELLRDVPDAAAPRSPDGWSALHLAAHFGQTAAAELLVRHGADVQAISANSMGNTPLHATLAGRGDLELVALLLAHHADVNARAAAGVTPLHLAAARGQPEIVELLLERGAVADARMENDTTPADVAAARAHLTIADRLRQRAAATLNTEPAPA